MVVLRAATHGDIDDVLDLWRAAGSAPGATDTREHLVRLLTADPQALLVAEADGTLVGSLIAAWDGWRASFYRLAVHPEHRRRGIAGRLLDEGERRLRARGAARGTAVVLDDDDVALGFWAHARYERQIGRARFVRMIAED